MAGSKALPRSSSTSATRDSAASWRSSGTDSIAAMARPGCSGDTTTSARTVRTPASVSSPAATTRSPVASTVRIQNPTLRPGGSPGVVPTGSEPVPPA